MNLEKKKNAIMNAVQSGGRLPDEFQEVEWIGCDGNQYISTFQEISIPYSIEAVSNASYIYSTLYGGRDAQIGYSSTRNRFFCWCSTQSLGITINDGIYDKFINTILEVNTLTELTVEGEKTQGSRLVRISNFEIFSHSNGSAKFIGKLQSLKVYENNDLRFDFIPCYRKSDNVIGLYDTINNYFYTNDGTGTFIKGPDV